LDHSGHRFRDRLGAELRAIGLGHAWLGEIPAERGVAGVFVDHKDVVWLAGSGAKDAQLLKFTREGNFLAQFGKPGMSGGSGDTKNMGMPANLTVDPATNEVYVADGYGNRRVIVIDGDTFAFKRMVFRKDGTYVKKAFIAKRTILKGAASGFALSADPHRRRQPARQGQARPHGSGPGECLGTRRPRRRESAKGCAPHRSNQPLVGYSYGHALRRAGSLDSAIRAIRRAGSSDPAIIEGTQ
jgi:hypothetical protein